MGMDAQAEDSSYMTGARTDSPDFPRLHRLLTKAFSKLSKGYRSFKRSPATAEFGALSDHLLRDIGMSRFEIDSLGSCRDRWG
jgi:uncharacterized protein YjiS (DUF1127 family)